jgi:hypothetical protein
VAQAEQDWQNFLKATEQGAARMVTGLKVAKVAGMLAATYLTGGAAGAMRLGTYGAAGLLGVGAGGYAAAQEFAGQAGEIIFSDREHFDWGRIAKVGAINAAAGVVGGVVGGKMAGLLGNSLGKMVGGMAPETMEAFGIAGAELLTNGERLFVQWVAGTGSLPFANATAKVMQDVLDGRADQLTVSGVLDASFSHMVEGGVINTFFVFAHAHSTATPRPSATRASSSGGGSGAGGPGGGSGGGRGGRGEAVPEHIGPEGDITILPEEGITSGIPEPIGPGTEPTQRGGPAFEPTQPANTSTGVPERVGPDGDVTILPEEGITSGIPEPVGPGTEPTQPVGSAYEPTQPVGAAYEPTQPAGPAFEPTQPVAAGAEAPTPAATPEQALDMAPPAPAEPAQAAAGNASKRTGGTLADESVVEQGIEPAPAPAEGRPAPHEYVSPNTFTRRRALYATNDTFEATQLIGEARAEGRTIHMLPSEPRMQEAWNVVTGQDTPAPAAFIDNAGRVYFDASRVGPEAGMTQGIPQGPVPNPGARVPDFEALTPEPPIAGDVPMENPPEPAPPEEQLYPGVSAGETRGVSDVINDPVAASRRYYSETVAGRGVRLISGVVQNGRYAGESNAQYAWVSEYGGKGQAPPAWIDGDGFLVVDADTVQMPLNAGEIPKGPVKQ